MDRQTDRQMDWMDRQTDTHTHTQTLQGAVLKQCVQTTNEVPIGHQCLCGGRDA